MSLFWSKFYSSTARYRWFCQLYRKNNAMDLIKKKINVICTIELKLMGYFKSWCRTLILEKHNSELLFEDPKTSELKRFIWMKNKQLLVEGYAHIPSIENVVFLANCIFRVFIFIAPDYLLSTMFSRGMYRAVQFTFFRTIILRTG